MESCCEFITKSEGVNRGSQVGCRLCLSAQEARRVQPRFGGDPQRFRAALTELWRRLDADAAYVVYYKADFVVLSEVRLSCTELLA